MRFLYLPNEHVVGAQIGPRKAFEKLAAKGEFSAYQAYSYLVERKTHRTQAEALAALAAVTRSFRPDVMFLQHIPADYTFDDAFLRKLKADNPGMRFIYHENDPWDRFIKRFSPTMKVAFHHADMAVLVGLGYLGDMARECGAKQVVFSLQSYDTIRFGKTWVPTEDERPLDVVMIANLTCLKRIPWLFLPGGASRKRLAWALHEEFGDRFALYGAGQGWDGAPFCRGTLAYQEQHDAIRSSWLSANWSQFDKISYYNSDKLPIALAAGVPHLTNYQPGYEELYDRCEGLFWFRSVKEAVDIARHLLSQPRSRLVAIGAKAGEYAAQYLEADIVYAELVQVIRDRLFPDDSRVEGRQKTTAQRAAR